VKVMRSFCRMIVGLALMVPLLWIQTSPDVEIIIVISLVGFYIFYNGLLEFQRSVDSEPKKTVDDDVIVVTEDDLAEQPHPMRRRTGPCGPESRWLCFSHGGSPVGADHNEKHGFECPRCKISVETSHCSGTPHFKTQILVPNEIMIEMTMLPEEERRQAFAKLVVEAIDWDAVIITEK